MLHFMQESPLISVIVPVYKVEQYLARCLESICGQTYRNLEIICVDDGSPDRSIDILNEFAAKDSRIQVIRQSNQGQSAARNRGLDISKGEWITFIDSDDWIEPDTLEICASHISDMVDIIVYGMSIDCEANIPDEKLAKIEEYSRLKFEGIRQFSDDVILSTNIYICNKLFRGSVVRKYELRFPDGRWYEDASFVYRFFLLAKNGYFIKNRHMYHYVQRDGSTMQTTREKSPRAIEHLDVIRDIYILFKSLHLTKNRLHLFATLADMYLSGAFCYSPQENQKLVAKKGAAIIKETGIGHFTEFPAINRVWEMEETNFLQRLFYRRRGSKTQYGILGLMILAIQRKHGYIIYCIFGVKIWRRHTA